MRPAEAPEGLDLYSSGRLNYWRVARERITEFTEQMLLYPVIMLDVDFFKKYNDTYGHEEGDKVLTQVGAILQMQVRDSDLASRFGGEEFILIMPETSSKSACRSAERIREAIARETPVTISLGVACFHKNCKLEKLISLADKALYMAKESGRNRLVKA